MTIKTLTGCPRCSGRGKTNKITVDDQRYVNVVGHYRCTLCKGTGSATVDVAREWFEKRAKNAGLTPAQLAEHENPERFEEAKW